MLPPYENKFVLYQDIADCITGFVRMIEFRCFAEQGIDRNLDFGTNKLVGSQADPTVD